MRKCSCLSVLIASTHSLKAISLRGVWCGRVCEWACRVCVCVHSLRAISLRGVWCGRVCEWACRVCVCSQSDSYISA